MINFSKLPLELKMHIFGNLELKEKENARLVCREWEFILNSFIQMNLLANDKRLDFIKKLGSSLNINSLRVQYLRERIPSTASRNILPKARIVMLGCENSDENIANLWRHGMSKAEELYLENKSLGKINHCFIPTVIPFVNWPNLVNIHISVKESFPRLFMDNWSSHINHLIGLAKLFNLLSVPSIKSIQARIECDLPEEFRNPFLPKLYKGLFGFLLRHKDSLRAFEAYLRGNADEKYVSLKDMRIQTLNINFDVLHIEIAMNLAEMGNQLKSLTLEKNFWVRRGPRDLPIQFLDTIKRNQNTLEHLAMHKMGLDCSWLDYCKALKHLDLMVWSPVSMTHRPVLQSLKRLEIVACLTPENDGDGASEETTRDNLVRWIGSCMVNLEEAVLEINGTTRLTFQNFTYLEQRLKKLQDLTLVRVSPAGFRGFVKDCMDNGREEKVKTKYTFSSKRIGQVFQIVYSTFRMQRWL